MFIIVFENNGSEGYVIIFIILKFKDKYTKNIVISYDDIFNRTTLFPVQNKHFKLDNIISIKINFR